MPLDGMVDKFMDLSNIGQYGIHVVSAMYGRQTMLTPFFCRMKVSHSYSHISLATVKAYTDGGASQVCRIFGKERYILFALTCCYR